MRLLRRMSWHRQRAHLPICQPGHAVESPENRAFSAGWGLELLINSVLNVAGEYRCRSYGSDVAADPFDTAVVWNSGACCRGSGPKSLAPGYAAPGYAAVERGNPAVDIGHYAGDWGAGAATCDRGAGRIGCTGRAGAAGYTQDVDIAATTADGASAVDIVGQGNNCIAALGPAGCRCATIGHTIGGLAVRRSPAAALGIPEHAADA